jgi:outer membrane lipoprotein SlyB
VNTVIVELDQEDAPGLGGCHVSQLANHASGKGTGVMLGHAKGIGGPVEGQVVWLAINNWPIQFIT